MSTESWKDLIGQVVVVDTNSRFVYIGTLAEVKPDFFVLKNVDAHDRNDGQATKEQYVMEAKQFGLRANRKEISVSREMVVSVSRLDDIVEY